MVAVPITALTNALQPLFPEQRISLTMLPEERAWSRVCVATIHDNTRVFLKGTPRTLPEAWVSAQLAVACPALVAPVLHTDLLPAADWCWFAIADVGQCAGLTLTPAQACQAVYALGLLQRTIHKDSLLAARLPTCLPKELYRIVLNAGTRLTHARDPNIRAQALPLMTRLSQLKPRFTSIAEDLALLPATCVHGDFWPGNLAFPADGVRIIDWGEAFWGCGGTAVWNLINTSAATLMPALSDIWIAYSQGWQTPISVAYRTAARCAFYVSMLAVDQQLHGVEADEDLADTLATVKQALFWADTTSTIN